MVTPDFDITEISFDNLPEGEEVIFVTPGKVYQFNSKFSINCILKQKNTPAGEKPTYFKALLPLGAIAAFPLGMVFKDQTIVNCDENLLIIDISLNLEIKKYDILKVSDVKELKKALLLRIPEYIGKHEIYHQIMDQNVFKFVDSKSKMNIIFPHYEIARWYYLKTSSLTRQVLSSNLEGLYSEAGYIDNEELKGVMTLKYGSNNDDAADIFRFAMDEFANIMFQNFSLDLSASIYEGDNFKSMNLMANFPVYGEIDFKIRGFELNNNTFFVYQILEENSRYPFEELNVLREIKGEGKNLKQVAQIKKKRVKVKPRARDKKPNPEFEEVHIRKGEEYTLLERRKDLDEKRITHGIVLIVDEEKELELKKKTESSTQNVDLSFGDKDTHEGSDTVRAELIDKPNKISEEDKRLGEILDHFVNMLFKMQNAENKKDEPRDISVTINEQDMPQKNPKNKSRKKWLKSKLSDNTTPRKYVSAYIKIDTKNYYVIEVQKDSAIEGLSTLVLHDVYNEIISDVRLKKIMINFVEQNGSWTKGYKDTNLKYDSLSHVKKFDNEVHLEGWAKNLLDKLDYLQ